jgi:Flp pilus assembly protein TadD
MQCGTALGAGGAATSGGWQLTLAGSTILVLFLSAGLTVWALVVSRPAPRPGPGGGAPHPPVAAPSVAGETHPKVEIPPEVKTFISDLSAKAKDKPDDVDTWLRLAQVNARASQLDPAYQADAIAAYEHVLQHDPQNAEALRGVANVHYDRDDHAKAIPAYEKYLALRPDDLSARTDLATMYLYSGQPERAIATYQDVIRANPSFLQAHYNLAVTYHGQGNDAAALKELETARGLATDDGVRKQIDDMMASLRGGTAPSAQASAGPAGGATAPAAPATAGDGARTPFQSAVESAFRASPIMGSRIVGFEWSSASSARVMVQNFPMNAMPADVRDKFTARLAQEVRTAQQAHPVDGAVRLEIADAGSGTVMASVVP